MRLEHAIELSRCLLCRRATDDVLLGTLADCLVSLGQFAKRAGAALDPRDATRAAPTASPPAGFGADFGAGFAFGFGFCAAFSARAFASALALKAAATTRAVKINPKAAHDSPISSLHHSIAYIILPL